ncbi:conjugal transfer protein TraH, partial [Providencia rettgeri]
DNQVTTTIPKVNRQELIKALMYGGTINIEGCVSVNGCLELKKKTVTVTKANGLNSLVSKTISQIQSKLKDDTALTPAEKGFIQSTSIPILRYLVDPMQLNLNVSILPALSDYIAYDILLQYLLELIDQAKIAMANRNFPEEPMKLLRENVSEASRQLEDLQRQVDVKANVLMEMERQMSYLRQQTSSQLQERYQRNYHFNMFTPEQKTQQGG